MNRYESDIRVFYALMQRELHGFGKTSKESLLDGVVQCATQMVLLFFLFPAIGMPTLLIGPMYIGSMISMLFSTGFSYAFKQLFDLRGARIIDYHLTLPLNKTWLMIAYSARAMIQMFMTTIPFALLAVYLSTTGWVTFEVKPLAFAIIYFLTLILFAVWYQTASFRYDLPWVLNNLWPRRLFFLFLFGCLFMPWHAIYAVCPCIAYIFLCNPITYVAEGWRASLLPANPYLPLPICGVVVSICVALGIMALATSMRKRLDPV